MKDFILFVVHDPLFYAFLIVGIMIGLTWAARS